MLGSWWSLTLHDVDLSVLILHYSLFLTPFTTHLMVPGVVEHLSNEPCALPNVLVHDSTGDHLQGQTERRQQQMYSTIDQKADQMHICRTSCAARGSVTVINHKMRCADETTRLIIAQPAIAATHAGTAAESNRTAQQSWDSISSRLVSCLLQSLRAKSLTLRKLASMLLAMARASSVFPVPGGP